MHWAKVEERWKKRQAIQPGQPLEGDITFSIEQWEIPGDEPLPVRICTRKSIPLSKYAGVRDTEKTSIVLHITAGYGNFGGLMGGNAPVSAHFLLGRDGWSYQCVPTRYIANHATWWNENSIGIEIDCIGNLRKVGD